MGKKHNSKFPAVPLQNSIGQDKENNSGEPGHRKALQHYPAHSRQESLDVPRRHRRQA